MSWQRARQPEQKAVRRQAILDAAAELFDEGGLEASGLSSIARESGVSKANIYRYFESREQILLELLTVEQRAWAEALEGELAAASGAADRAWVAAAFAGTLAERPRLCALLPVVPTVLELNVGLEALTEVKEEVVRSSIRVIHALHAALPDLELDRAREVVSGVLLFAGALWPVTHPSPIAETAAERAGLVPVDFEVALARFTLVLIEGMRQLQAR